MELGHLIHWLDRGAGVAVSGLRSSPAWCFVTAIGMLGVVLTVLLFVSAIEQTSRRESSVPHQAAHHGRETLEKNNEWSAQDRWRVAHFFVPHKPAHQTKEIQLDSRMTIRDGRDGIARTAFGTQRNSASAPGRRRYETDADVRLDLNRPKKAQQGRRLVAGANFDADRASRSQIRRRNPRLLVQASWEFGSDCNRYDYVSIPVRRPIAVPDPEPEIVTLPIRRPAPDLGFAMEMVRRFTASSFFPPGSHFVSQSDRSVISIDDRWVRNELASFSELDWRRSNISNDRAREPIAPYSGIANTRPISRVDFDDDETNPSLPASTQVDLRLQLSAPRAASGGHVNLSKLLVTNEGQDPVQRIEVEERISELQTVVAAEPDGTITDVVDSLTGSEVQLLRREAEILMPGDSNEFALKWIPNSGRRHFHRARVIAHAAVYAKTDVNEPDPDQQMSSIPPELPPEKHPQLACAVQYLDRVYVGDSIELEITVRNTGDTTLHDVQVRIAIPDQLSHPDGKTVIFDAGKLLVRGQNRTVLKMSALQAGDAVNSLEAAAAEKIEARGNTRILVVERSKEPNPLPPLPEVIPSPPKLVPIPAKTISPVKLPPNDECCCQRSAATGIESVLQLP